MLVKEAPFQNHSCVEAPWRPRKMESVPFAIPLVAWEVQVTKVY
jgi:hypothetical protein